MKKNITVLGAGLVGSLLSIYFAKRGHRVDIFERRPDMRREKMSAGKSINLALSDRGWRGLERTGIADEIRKVAIPMYGRKIHLANGELNFQPYGEKDQAIWSVSRGGLNMELMNLAEKHQEVKIHFEERCTGVDFEKSISKFENTRTHAASSHTSDHIFGA